MNYEICFWLKDAGDDSLPVKDLEIIRAAIEKSGASIVSEKPLEKRALAYPIKKQKNGFWGEIQFFGESSVVEKIRKSLQYENDILRKMIFELPKPKKVKKAKPVSAKIDTSAGDLKKEEKTQVSEETLDTKLKEIFDYESR